MFRQISVCYTIVVLHFMSKKRCWVKGLGLLLLFLYSADGFCQKAEMQLSIVKSRQNSIETFLVDIKLEVGISLIKMPYKEAQAAFKKDEDVVITSKDFVRIPKRGLDVSFSELFEYPFMVIDRDKVEEQSAFLLAISRFRKIFIRHLFDL